MVNNKKSRLIYLLFIISLLCVTRFGSLIPSNFIHVVGLFRLEEIGLAIAVFLFFITKRKERIDRLPNYFLVASFTLFIFIAFEILRTLFEFNQGLILTIKVVRHLLYFIYIPLIPKIINNEEKLIKTIKVLVFFSLLSGIIYIYQAFSHNMIFDAWFTIQSIGSFAILRTFDSFPVFLVYVSLGILYHILNNQKVIQRKNISQILLYLFTTFLVIISFSRNLWLSYMVITLIVLIISKKNKLKVLFIGSSILIIFLLLFSNLFGAIIFRTDEAINDFRNSEGTYGYRVQILFERIELINNVNPLFGVGLINQENDYYDNYFVAGGKTSNNIAVIHGDNAYASVFATMGYFGFIVFILFYLSGLKFSIGAFRKLNNFKPICIGVILYMVSTLIVSFFGSGFFGMYFVYYWIGLGMIRSILLIDNKNKGEKDE